MASSRNRVLLGLAIASAAIAAVACTEHGTLPTAPSTPVTFASDTARPNGAVIAPAGILNVGDVIRAIVSDDRAVRDAYLILLDSTGSVRWRSATVQSGVKNDTLAFSTTGVAVSPGLVLNAVVAVHDSAGKFRYGGTTTALATDSSAAPKVAVAFAAGLYVTLPSGGTVGSLDYDKGLGIVVLSDKVSNAVVGVAIDAGAFLPWRVSVGSSPGIILTTPGTSGHLITVNGTGTDISSVYFSLSSARELGRTAVPAASITAGTASASAGYNAVAGAATCPTTDCTNPIALLAMPGDSDSLAVTRTVPIVDVPSPLSIDILTPLAAANAGDVTIQAEVSETDRSTGQTETTNRNSRSRCTTLPYPGNTTTPGPLWAAADSAGPVFMDIPTVPISSVCAQIVRLDWDGAGNLVPNVVAINAGLNDPSLGHAALDLATNNDGSSVAVAHSTNVVITDGGLRRIGTIAVDSVRRVTFVRGGTVPMVAVSRGNTIDIYETNHFQMVARYPVAKPVSEIVAVIRDNQLRIVAATVAGQGVVILRTDIPAVSATFLKSRNVRQTH